MSGALPMGFLKHLRALAFLALAALQPAALAPVAPAVPSAIVSISTLAVTAAAVTAALLAPVALPAPAAAAEKRVVAFYGQSNEGAQGGVCADAGLTVGSTIPRTFILRNDAGYFEPIRLCENTSQPPAEADRLDRFGPEVGFARKVRERFPDDDLFIVKRWRGGSSFVHPTQWHPLYQNNYWTGLKADIRAALLAAGPGARLVCVGVNQGEANRTEAAAWARQVREMIRQINGLVGYPVRYVFMRLTPNGETAPEIVDATADFRRFEQELEDDVTLDFRLIDVDSVPKQPDVVHFTAHGILTIGALREAACFGP
ncbi:sialate O-acetylesterase [Hansschlegelia zhihuaiae]|uniref:Sialate O-acetylesterase domain-containing protein n=1 Tax=Hansschlegelia zhihuaiae TaxID=405005 RepID=A0A4Q0M464_9HYPH|nr:sialate O-acetylesterase [Hansschlegelia zhihuaiae]RXF67674.1 hypothetical protein EK403_20945 [Hansschlegelia zhihuaiae]